MKPPATISIWILASILGYYLGRFPGMSTAMSIALILTTFINEGFDKALEYTQIILIFTASAVLAVCCLLILENFAHSKIPDLLELTIYIVLTWRFYQLLKVKKPTKECSCKRKE